MALCLGLAIGCSFWAFVLSPLPIWTGVLLFVALNIGFAFLGAGRIKGFTRVCMKCKYKGRWDRCPGMKDTIENLESDGIDTQASLKYGFRNL